MLAVNRESDTKLIRVYYIYNRSLWEAIQALLEFLQVFESILEKRIKFLRLYI